MVLIGSTLGENALAVKHKCLPAIGTIRQMRQHKPVDEVLATNLQALMERIHGITVSRGPVIFLGVHAQPRGRPTGGMHKRLDRLGEYA